MLPKVSLLSVHRYLAANFLFLIFCTLGSQIMHTTCMHATDFTIPLSVNSSVSTNSQIDSPVYKSFSQKRFAWVFLLLRTESWTGVIIHLGFYSHSKEL